MEGFLTNSDFERTMAHAEAAMAQFRANETPAYPANYELWYTYSCGFNHGLNKAINEILRKKGRILPEEVQNIYDEHLSSMRLSNQVEQVGSLVGNEIYEISALLDSAQQSADSYGQTLSGAHEQLHEDMGAPHLAQLVRNLIDSTHEMEQSNKDLKTRLNDSKKQIEELQNSIEAIRFQSLTDELTGIANRKCFDQTISDNMTRAEATSQPVSLLLCDIDHFKAFNDTYGHQTGDQVLRLVGSTLKNHSKGRDLAARYGGEEFAVLLPDTNTQQAIMVAENIRKAVRNKELIKRSTGEHLGRVTMSIGVSTNRPHDTVDGLIHRADMCLYAAKGSGRDCVRSQNDPDIAKVSKVA